MEFRYKIHSDIGFTFIEVKGEAVIVDEQRMLAAVSGDPAFAPNMKILVDRRQSKMDVHFPDAKQFVPYVEAMQETLGHPTVAVVVGGELDYGLQRMFQSLSDGVLKHEYKIFRTIEEALEWLDVDLPADELV